MRLPSFTRCKVRKPSLLQKKKNREEQIRIAKILIWWRECWLTGEDPASKPQRHGWFWWLQPSPRKRKSGQITCERQQTSLLSQMWIINITAYQQTYSLVIPALWRLASRRYISSLVRVSTSSKLMSPNCNSLAFSSSSMVALIFELSGANGEQGTKEAGSEWPEESDFHPCQCGTRSSRHLVGWKHVRILRCTIKIYSVLRLTALYCSW